ncbi:MAG: zinc ribbon domain-containing protein [Methanobrevibacter sp.]|uniref:zinc ribbon domain-containing protein n=1 Tax=Methanobrevibacter sp. TaxID=66852 RepID=UPI001D7EE27D|nr:zinc ribbon domain-containing protein [Methanobrevibacter sp.]MBE6490797.1 zinc ribbon domain-containing protein [Methanobrevibacter sp.]MEE0935141.1 zinc ribbon domain-containing protein [Methanobrevibacter sp.]
MKCSNCNAENSDGAKFCKKCGNPLEEKTINHEEIINSVGNVKTKSDDNTTKIIIIALVIVAIVLAGAFAYIYMSGNSDSGSASNAGSASNDADKVDSSQQAASSNPEKTAKSQTTSMKIKGGSFSTGSAESDKTYATIYVGTENAGKDVIVQIFYSRDGNSLNNGNMVPASVHSDGYLYITSADAYHYYPDYATIKLYDSNSNLLDTQSVSLSPTSGTQTF